MNFFQMKSHSEMEDEPALDRLGAAGAPPASLSSSTTGGVVFNRRCSGLGVVFSTPSLGAGGGGMSTASRRGNVGDAPPTPASALTAAAAAGSSSRRSSDVRIFCKVHRFFANSWLVWDRKLNWAVCNIANFINYKIEPLIIRSVPQFLVVCQFH